MRRVAVYLLMALAMTWPLALHLGSASVGFPGVDASDTATLRGMIADWLSHPRLSGGVPTSTSVYFPTGYPTFALTPNLLDHLSAAPLDWILPFPLSDNLWWLALLTLNGLCAHRMGRTLGGSEEAGWLAGTAFLWSEPLVREVNLHHAPQSMLFWGPLAVEALWRLRASPSWKLAVHAGIWLAGAALSYWYYGMFLWLGALPLLLLGSGRPGRPPLRLGALVYGVAALICLPWLAPLLLGWASGAITAGGRIPPPVSLPDSYALVPEATRFVAQHGNDLLFWLRRTPIDVSSRVSLVLLVAAALAGRGQVPDRGWRRALWGMVALGALMLLGPWLRWGDDLVSLGGQAISLPFSWLGSLHPFLARLTWPERWAVLLPLGLAGLAARAPRPRLLAIGVALEGLLLSGNLPLQTTDLHLERCWSALSVARGAVLELPLARPALVASLPGVHRRFYRRPLVNPLLLPPGAQPPSDWKTWATQSPLMVYLDAFEHGQSPEDPGAEAVRALRRDGISAIAVDAEPDGVLTPSQITRYKAGIGRHLGPPIDIGCALVWWLDTTASPPAAVDGEAWRAAAARYQADHPAPTLNTLMSATGPTRAND